MCNENTKRSLYELVADTERSLDELVADMKKGQHMSSERDAVQVTRAMDERTFEARAHERGMVAYSAYLGMSAFAGSRLDLAERAYREAYDLAMGRDS